MAIVGGFCLRLTQTTLRAIQLLASIVVLAIFSYYLAILRDHDLPIASRYKAVEGMAGAAVLYGLFAVLLTLFLGGVAFFAFFAVVLDLCFVGCFAAIAYFTRGGAHKCSGNVNTPLGSGPANSTDPGYGSNGFGFDSGENLTYAPNLRQACRLESAVFACALINICLFLITAVLQVLLVRHHKREKRYGPSPSNGYTSGVGRTPFWRRNKRNTRDAELATGGHHEKHGIRPSHDTGYTGTTVENSPPAQHGHGHVQPTTATNY